MAIAHPCALHIACRGQFNHFTTLCRTKVPHGIYIVMIGQYLAERVAFTRDDIHHPVREIRGLEHLVAVGSAEGRPLRRDRNHRVAHGYGGSNQRDKTQHRILVGAGHADHADGLIHRQHNAAQWWTMHHAFVFVRPGRITKEARDCGLYLANSVRIWTSALLHNPVREFLFTYRQVLRHIVQNLCAIMRGASRPATGSMGSFNRVADILPIPFAHLADDTMLEIVDIAAIA